MEFLWVPFISTGIIFTVPASIFLILFKAKKKKMEKYIKTKGIITTSVYNGFNYNNGMNPNVQIGVGNAQPGMAHRVYEYEVNGTKYSRAETPMLSPDLIKKTLGMEVDVYYKPSDPKESFICVPGKTDIYKVLLIVFSSLSIGLIFLGIISLVFIR